MDLHVRGRGQNVGHSRGDVSVLQTLNTPHDGLRLLRSLRIHGSLELCLHQAGGDGGQPDVGPEVPHLLPPALQQACHGELGGRVEPGGGIGGDSVAGHGADHDDLAVSYLVPRHGLDTQLSAQAEGYQHSDITD